ncbi:hypothetical protein Pdw03_7968 [Penicillium digitatum]|uniref:Uncharacterized protein n=1 Tax=Penicillium digitatum TaxID=36651 RepID=A0A7T6XMY8_PENDI|nr:hypothetical protein Pdw03_7968 [Penicillium digitatum]
MRPRLSHYYFSSRQLKHFTFVESHLERIALASAGFARRFFPSVFFPHPSADLAQGRRRFGLFYSISGVLV